MSNFIHLLYLSFLKIIIIVLKNGMELSYTTDMLKLHDTGLGATD